MTENRKSDCPINYGLEFFGDRWSLLIIRDIMFNGKQSYGDFLASDEKISTNILANRLKMLQEIGLIQKYPDPAHGSKSIYSLTAKGMDLLPVLLEITAWSAKYDHELNVDQGFVNRYRQDRSKVLQEVVQKRGLTD
ncbi:MAG: helix-turn-helix domain-containing protein [Bacteroidota bacterium]